jgi:hypothetical protein
VTSDAQGRTLAGNHSLIIAEGPAQATPKLGIDSFQMVKRELQRREY